MQILFLTVSEGSLYTKILMNDGPALNLAQNLSMRLTFVSKNRSPGTDIPSTRASFFVQVT